MLEDGARQQSQEPSSGGFRHELHCCTRYYLRNYIVRNIYLFFEYYKQIQCFHHFFLLCLHFTDSVTKRFKKYIR